MTAPYWSSDDGALRLYLGDCRELLPALGVQADLIVADPPYAETSLPWDRWPAGWPTIAAELARSMWCFGSMRMYLDRRSEFAAWRLSQDVVWQKQNATGPDADRFRRVHEHVLHWYRGPWREVHHEAQRVVTGVLRHGVQKQGVRNIAQRNTQSGGSWIDNGTRLMTSVVQARSTHHNAIHPTEKPVDLLDPLIRYGCPPGGLVVDPFAGSASTLAAAPHSRPARHRHRSPRAVHRGRREAPASAAGPASAVHRHRSHGMTARRPTSYLELAQALTDLPAAVRTARRARGLTAERVHMIEKGE